MTDLDRELNDERNQRLRSVFSFAIENEMEIADSPSGVARLRLTGRQFSHVTVRVPNVAIRVLFFWWRVRAFVGWPKRFGVA